MILNAHALVFAVTALASALEQEPTQDGVHAVRRLAATAQLAAQEYRIGIVNGRVVSQAEVDEARLFLQEARRSAALLSAEGQPQAIQEVDALIRLVEELAPPDTLDARVEQLANSLTARFGVVLDEIPAQTPSVARGAEVYRSNCAGCHGDRGLGDGPLANSLDPKPSNLSDPEALRDQSPLDFYRKISIGVVGTAMPAFEPRLSPQDRWAVAVYASLLRLPTSSGDVPPVLRSFATTGRMSDAEVLAALGESGSSTAMGRLASVRAFQPDASASSAGQVLSLVRAQVESAYVLARQGHSSASTRAFDAYMTFEQVEGTIRAKNPALAGELEAAFATLRTRASGGATESELAGIRDQLNAGLENAERTLNDQLSPASLFLQSFIILFREGLEAILLVGALMTFLVKMGAAHRKRDIHIGVGTAIIASFLTAVALETIFQVSAAKREVLEGVTMMLAAVVLFYVSYWLLSKLEVAKWNHFVKSKVQDALTSGSGLALATAAFLAVYREGFETVLFYKALFLTGGAGATMPIVAGILLGIVVMAVVYVAINRFGVRLPLKPFFGVTSAFLYYMAFVFGGKGVAELQEGGILPTTFIPGAPRIPSLGIYPTLESLLVQGVLVALLVAGLLWTFVLQPRRNRKRSFPPDSLQPPSQPVGPRGPEEAGLEALRPFEAPESRAGRT